MMRQHFGAANVVATFPDVEAARRAITDLERHGVDAAHISLLGPGIEQDATLPATRAADAGEATHIVKAALKGGATGAVLGGLAGLVGGLAAFAIPGVGPVVGTGIWLTTLSGVAFGAGLGLTLGGVASLPVSEAWELAQHLQAGCVLVGVHSDDPEEVERAAEVLRKHNPLRLDRFGADGRLTPRPVANSGPKLASADG